MTGAASEEAGNFKAALHHYTKALALSEAQNLGASMPIDLNNLASVNLALANYIAAIQYLDHAQLLLAKNSLPTAQVKVLGNLGLAWMRLGQLDKAGGFLQKALTLVQLTGERSAEWCVATRLAMLYHLSGETARAITFALQHYHVAEPTGDSWVLTYLADMLAKLYAAIGDGQQSLDWAQRLQEHARQKQQWRYQVRGKLRLAQAQSLLQQHDAAFSAIAQAVAHYASQKQTLEEEPELFTTYARCAGLVGKPQLAGLVEQKAQTALQRQFTVISNPALQASFLRVQT